MCVCACARARVHAYTRVCTRACALVHSMDMHASAGKNGGAGGSYARTLEYACNVVYLKCSSIDTCTHKCSIYGSAHAFLRMCACVCKRINDQVTQTGYTCICARMDALRKTPARQDMHAYAYICAHTRTRQDRERAYSEQHAIAMRARHTHAAALTSSPCARRRAWRSLQRRARAAAGRSRAAAA